MITIATIFNVLILILLMMVSVYIFFDSRKYNNSFLDSLLWAIIGFFIFPPLGIVVYFHKRKAFEKRIPKVK
jgi:hypothetical protein